MKNLLVKSLVMIINKKWYIWISKNIIFYMEEDLNLSLNLF